MHGDVTKLLEATGRVVEIDASLPAKLSGRLMLHLESEESGAIQRQAARLKHWPCAPRGVRVEPAWQDTFGVNNFASLGRTRVVGSHRVEIALSASPRA